jgi:hypothetical protein
LSISSFVVDAKRVFDEKWPLDNGSMQKWLLDTISYKGTQICCPPVHSAFANVLYCLSHPRTMGQKDSNTVYWEYIP